MSTHAQPVHGSLPYRNDFGVNYYQYDRRVGGLKKNEVLLGRLMLSLRGDFCCACCDGSGRIRCVEWKGMCRMELAVGCRKCWHSWVV